MWWCDMMCVVCPLMCFPTRPSRPKLILSLWSGWVIQPKVAEPRVWQLSPFRAKPGAWQDHGVGKRLALNLAKGDYLSQHIPALTSELPPTASATRCARFAGHCGGVRERVCSLSRVLCLSQLWWDNVLITLHKLHHYLIHDGWTLQFTGTFHLLSVACSRVKMSEATWRGCGKQIATWPNARGLNGSISPFW